MPLSKYLPLLGVSRQPIRFISVDLPEPDGPMIATYSPFLIVEAHAAQGVDLLRAHLIGAPEVLGEDDGRAVRGCRDGRFRARRGAHEAFPLGLSVFTLAWSFSVRSVL